MTFRRRAAPAARGWVAAALAAVALAAVPPATASAAGAELSAIAGAYAQHGSVPACEFTSDQLSAALSEAGGDIQQYGADLLAAIQAALSARAAGACDKRSGTVVTTATTTITTTRPPASGPPVSPARVRTVVPPPAPPSSTAILAPARVSVVPLTAPTRGPVPAPLGLIAIAAAVAVLAGSLAAVWALRGWDPLWLAGARHAVSEAGHRLSGLAADLGDWSRGAR